MSAQLDTASSPIEISSRMSSPQVISISSDPALAQESDIFANSGANNWDRRTAREPGIGSHAPSIRPSQPSRASISSLGYSSTFGTTPLRATYSQLQAENEDIKARFETLQ